MRVTVCELPHETRALAEAWPALCDHVAANASQLVLLPELAMLDPVWEADRFDASRWTAFESRNAELLRRLPSLRADHVVGTRPVTSLGRRWNEGFLWSAAGGLQPLRKKYFLPQEPGTWEATWFDRGDPDFPTFRAGTVSFGLNICSELWALETYAAYAALGVDLILTPRATPTTSAARWRSLGVVAAVRSGAFSLSSNRVDAEERVGACGGGSWIIDPDGEILALTSPAEPFATRDIDLAKTANAADGYPRYVFADGAALSR